MGKFKLMTKKGYTLFEVASAFQKCIRRGMEEDAMYWTVELFNSGYDEYLWKRVRIITSEDIGLANPTLPAVIASLYSSYLEQKKKKDTKHQPERLFITHAVLLLARSEKSRVVDHALLYFWSNHYCVSKQIPSFAYDIHTKEGRRLGFGIDHFFKESTRLTNMAKIEKEDYYKQQALCRLKDPCKPGPGTADQTGQTSLL